MDRYIENVIMQLIVKQYDNGWAGVILGTDVHVTGSSPVEMLDKVYKGLGIDKVGNPIIIVFYDEIIKQLDNAIKSEDYIEILGIEEQHEKERLLNNNKG